MTERRRLESVSGFPADRDSRAEALLVEGLDRYFSGDYEDAIHVWTRVLFLDRSHARARAYIDRARTALAECQRRADEMLQTAEELVGQGELDRARSLLSQAARVAADDERVARVWTEIERVERVRMGTRRQSPSAAGQVVPLRIWRPAPGALLTLVAAGAVGALIVTLMTSPVLHEWFRSAPGTGTAPVPARLPVPPVPASDDVALLRARTLYARGRLAEALRALDRASPTGASRDAVDALRVEIQEVLLSTTSADRVASRVPGDQP